MRHLIWLIAALCTLVTTTSSALPHHPLQLKKHHTLRYTLHPGSLRNNITRLAKQHGWQTVIWQPATDYTWLGELVFKNSTLKGLLRQILQDFPLQAVFYEGNHVLVIKPRDLQ